MRNLSDNDIYSTENANDVHQKSLSKLERVCSIISDKVGTAKALVLVAIIQVVWVIVGQWSGLDPYTFPFLLTISNMIQLSLIFVLALGQRQSTMHAKIRANLDHKSITNILSALKIQNELLASHKQNDKS